MCTAHREPRYSSITTIGTTFHIQHRSIQTKSTPHPTPQPKNSKPLRHNVPHPTPKHTDKVNTAPHTTTQELKTPSAQRSASNTEAYRQKSTPHPTPQPKNSKPLRHNVPHPIPKHTDKSQHRITHHNPRTLKKSPRGVQRGRGFTAPLRFSIASQSKKTGPLPRK